jgi:AAA domain
MRVTPPQAPKVVLLRTSEIVPERIDWIWPEIIAIRRVTGLVGYPGLGKSQVAIDVAATVSTGRHWPGGASNGRAGHVIILSAEDDPADTIVPRLIAAGADRSRIHIVKAVKDGDGERPFNLAVDLDLLEQDYDLQQVNLLVIDPVSAYLGQTRGKPINRVTISAEEALAAAAKKPPSAAIDFLQQALSDGPMDQTEIVRRGREAGFTEKNLRSAREKLGVEPTKEGFGAKGKWVWVPPGGATLLKLVVDNDPHKPTPPAADSQHAQDAGTATEPSEPEGGPDNPDGGNAA